MTARGLYWRRVKARASDAENSGGVWRRVEGLMKTIFHRKADRRVYFSMGVICGLIGEAKAVVAARQWSLMY